MYIECPVPPTSIFGGACVEACDSDTDCTNGQICCGNGCGHECMTPVVDPCAVSVIMNDRNDLLYVHV